MRVLGIDPGTSYFAWGLVVDGALDGLGYRGGSDTHGLPEADAYVIEIPQVYKSRRGSNPTTILDLGAAAGGLVGLIKLRHPRATILTPRPSEWKGQVPKDIHQSRIKAAFGEGGKRVMRQCGLSPAHLGHAVDGAGLALWGEKQLANAGTLAKV